MTWLRLGLHAMMYCDVLQALKGAGEEYNQILDVMGRYAGNNWK